MTITTNSTPNQVIETIRFKQPLIERSHERVNISSIAPKPVARVNHPVTTQKNLRDRISNVLIKSGNLRKTQAPGDRVPNWINRIARNTSRSTNKTIRVESFFKVKPEKIPVNDLQSVAESTMKSIDNRYTGNGCYERHFHISRALESQLGKDSCFMIILNNSDLSDTIRSPVTADYLSFPWCFHVVTGVRADDGEIYILDPSVSTQQAVPMSTWMNQLSMSDRCRLRVAPTSYHYSASFNDETEQSLKSNCKQQLNKGAQQYKKEMVQRDHLNQLNPGKPPCNLRFTLGEPSDIGVSFDSISSKREVRLDTWEYRDDNGEWQPIFQLSANQEPLSLQGAIDYLQEKGVHNLEINKLPCLLDDPTSRYIIQ